MNLVSEISEQGCRGTCLHYRTSPTCARTGSCNSHSATAQVASVAALAPGARGCCGGSAVNVFIDATGTRVKIRRVIKFGEFGSDCVTGSGYCLTHQSKAAHKPNVRRGVRSESFCSRQVRMSEASRSCRMASAADE